MSFSLTLTRAPGSGGNDADTGRVGWAQEFVELTRYSAPDKNSLFLTPGLEAAKCTANLCTTFADVALKG